MRLVTSCVVLGLGLWAGVSNAVPVEEGSQAANTGGYRGPNGDGLYPASALLKEWPKEGPRLLWSANCGDGYAGPTVAEGIAYLPGGTQGVLYVYSMDGKLLNRLPFGSCTWTRWSGTRSTPIVRDGVAVCTTPGSSVVGLDLRTGEQRWSVNAWKSFGTGKGSMGWGYAESPVNIDHKAIVNCSSRDDQSPPFVAIDVRTGKPAWEANPGPGRMAYSSADCASAAPKALNSTLIFSTVIQNDAPRYVRFRFLTPDGISWNYRQRLDARMWFAGKVLDEKTVYKLEPGRYPLLLQTATGEVEGWGKIWMCPRFIDCTPEIERKLADCAKGSSTCRKRRRDENDDQRTPSRCGGIEPGPHQARRRTDLLVHVGYPELHHHA